MSMCLVLACWTGLDARAIEEMLLHMIGTGVELCTLNSYNKHLSQVISHVVSAKALYSASVDDLETTFCFLDCQEIRLEPRKIP
ncbi:hypothetical protein Tco_1444164 [Tanacetum coccineum]